MKGMAHLVGVAVIALTTYMYGTQPAAAINADVAKKCRELAIKAHPTAMAGTKASGTEKAQRAYFQDCVAKEERKQEKTGK
jgi:hypothetical protein